MHCGPTCFVEAMAVDMRRALPGLWVPSTKAVVAVTGSEDGTVRVSNILNGRILGGLEGETLSSGVLHITCRTMRT